MQTKLAIAAFIVPYMFAMNPSMLLMDQGVPRRSSGHHLVLPRHLRYRRRARGLCRHTRTLVAAYPACRRRPVPDRPQTYDRPCRYRGDRDRRCAADRFSQAQRSCRGIKKPEPFSQEHVRYFWRASFCAPCAAARRALHVPADGVYYLYTRRGKEQSA